MSDANVPEGMDLFNEEAFLNKLRKYFTEPCTSVWLAGDGKVYWEIPGGDEVFVDGKYGTILVVTKENGEVVMTQPYFPIMINEQWEHGIPLRHFDIPEKIDLTTVIG